MNTLKLRYTGLAKVYKSDLSYFMSATFDRYQRKLLRDAFDVAENEIIEFPNLLTFITGKETKDFDFSSEVSKEVNELKEKLY